MIPRPFELWLTFDNQNGACQRPFLERIAMMTLSRFATKLTNLIVAVLSCLDRIIFKGGAVGVAPFLAPEERGWPLSTRYPG